MLHTVGWLRTDVSGLSIVPIFKGQLTVKMGPIDSLETSVLNQPTLRNIPEDGRRKPTFSLTTA